MPGTGRETEELYRRRYVPGQRLYLDAVAGRLRRLADDYPTQPWTGYTPSLMNGGMNDMEALRAVRELAREAVRHSLARQAPELEDLRRHDLGQRVVARAGRG